MSGDVYKMKKIAHSFDEEYSKKSDIDVSVIVPVYNVEKYLYQCLDSIANQTLKNIEIICVDDCSSDSSMEILHSFTTKDNRFVIKQNKQNSGAAYSRNAGLEIAKGKYVSFVDSDDFFAADYLESMFEKCEKYVADLAVCRCDDYHNRSGVVSENIWQCPSVGKEKLLRGVFSLKDVPAFLNIVAHPPFTKMCRRDFVKKNHIKFQILPNCNDVYFNLCVQGLANRIVHINQALIYYRTQRENSITTSRSKHPLCVYMAIRQTIKRLSGEAWWPFLRPYFNSQFIVSICYELSCSTENVKRRMMNFWVQRGFKNIGIEACNENDFSEIKYYMKLKDVYDQCGI